MKYCRATVLRKFNCFKTLYCSLSGSLFVCLRCLFHPACRPVSNRAFAPTAPW